MIFRGSGDGTDEVIFRCQCENMEHQFHVWTWSDDGDLGFQVALNPQLGFWRRLKTAVKYLFLSPKHRNFGFEEVLIDYREAEELAAALIEHLMKWDKTA